MVIESGDPYWHQVGYVSWISDVAARFQVIGNGNWPTIFRVFSYYSKKKALGL